MTIYLGYAEGLARLAFRRPQRRGRRIVVSRTVGTTQASAVDYAQRTGVQSIPGRLLACQLGRAS